MTPKEREEDRRSSNHSSSSDKEKEREETEDGRAGKDHYGSGLASVKTLLE
jgi:hypothetical protein